MALIAGISTTYRALISSHLCEPRDNIGGVPEPRVRFQIFSFTNRGEITRCWPGDVQAADLRQQGFQRHPADTRRVLALDFVSVDLNAGRTPAYDFKSAIRSRTQPKTP